MAIRTTSAIETSVPRGLWQADEGIAAVVVPSTFTAATASKNADSGEQIESKNADDDDEEDPLDAFMAGIEQTVAKEKKAPVRPVVKPRRDDFEDEDDQGACRCC